MVETEDVMEVEKVDEAGGGMGKACKNPICNKHFTPTSGNQMYCTAACRLMNGRVRSASISSISGEKRKRADIVCVSSITDETPREELIQLLTDLQSDYDSLFSHSKQLEGELIRIKLKIADGVLDKIFNNEQPQLDSNLQAQKQIVSYATVAKPVTIIAQLDPEIDTENFNGNSLDTFFKSDENFPTLKSFNKKDKVARLVFNNASDAKKAQEILKGDPQLKSSVKSFTQRSVNYPIVALATGVENLGVLKEEIELRNQILRGNISSVKILSKNKSHVKIYVTSKKVQQDILKLGEISIKKDTGEFKTHKIREMNLDREVKSCYKCHKLGHIAHHCESKSDICARCSETHKTTECLLQKFKCVNCKNGEHRSDDPKCPERIKAVQRLKKLLS